MSATFVLTGVKFRTFWGISFEEGRPVVIPDAATITRCRADPAFMEMVEAQPFVQRDEQVVVHAPALAVDPDACPKCGKTLKKQGRHFHIKACKG